MDNVPENIRQVIKEFVSGVNKILGDRVKKVILYGSYARGDFKENSDIDIMILTDLSKEEITKYCVEIWDYAYDLEFDNDFAFQLSPLVKNIDDFNEYSDCVPFCMNIQKEGVILNG